MREAHRIKQRIAGVLLLLFSIYYANVCFFTHSHIVGGVTIVHSHFHGSHHHSTDDSSQHSGSQLTLIAALSQLLFLDAEIDAPSISPTYISIPLTIYHYSPSTQMGNHLHPSLRGPPSFALS